MDHFNIEIVGTSHISPESKKRIVAAFNRVKPDIICVELDSQRLHGLKNRSASRPGVSMIRKIGFTAYLFALIGGFIQKKLGNLTGMMPGEDMLLGVTLAKDNKLRVELIDQDIRITLRKINRMPFREKMRIVWDVIRAPFQRKKKMKINIAGIPSKELIRELTNQVKSRYPYIYKVVIDERNKVMAKRLFVLRKNNPGKQILAVVGEGHVEGINKDLKRLEESNIGFISYSTNKSI